MLTPLEKENLQRFIGYGNLNAPVWFLGMEEASGGEEKLRVRASFSPIEDLCRAQTELGYGFHFEGRRKRQPQWWIMSDIMLRLGGHKSPDREDRRAYQATRLGRVDGETLLTDLMFIPKPNLQEWDYPLSFPEFSSAGDFYASALTGRLDLLSELISKHQPPIIVAYGKAFWNHYEGLTGMVTRRELSGFRVCEFANTSMILTHMLSSKEMNGRIPALVEIISSRLSPSTAP